MLEPTYKKCCLPDKDLSCQEGEEGWPSLTHQSISNIDEKHTNKRLNPGDFEVNW